MQTPCLPEANASNSGLEDQGMSLREGDLSKSRRVVQQNSQRSASSDPPREGSEKRGDDVIWELQTGP